MSWNKVAALAVIIGLGFMTQAARADDIGATISEKFSGWTTHQVINGDLDGDGKPDVAAILSKPPEGDDDKGQALLVVFLADGKGGYALNTQSEKAICVGCGGPKAAFGEPLGELSIAKGLLHITYEGGSRDAFDDEVKWRLDKASHKLLLIGEMYRGTDTLGDDPDTVLDINYLTLKAEKAVGKKKHPCAVAAEFKPVELSAFDYDGKHIDDIEKITEACDKK